MLDKQIQQALTDTVAMETIQSIQQLMVKLKSDPDNYDLIVQSGNAFHDIGRYNQAIRYYKKANTIQLVEDVIIDLGVCYFNLGKLDSALTIIEKALRQNPDHKQGLYNIGIVLFNLGNINGALDNWQHLIHTHPNTSEADRVQQYINEIKNTQTGI